MYEGEYTLTNVRSILPKAVGDSIEEGVRAFGKRISGFDREDALLSGIESRTSSPVRIVRDQELAANMAGIYPCGEGAVTQAESQAQLWMESKLLRLCAENMQLQSS